MAKELDLRQTIDPKELLMLEIMQSEVFINLLDRKGIINKDELLEGMKLVHASMVKDKMGDQ